MKNLTTEQGYRVRNTHFPISAFLATLAGFLLISGIHTGLIVGVNALEVNHTVQTGIIILYWIIISASFTFYTRWQMKRAYEKPMKSMAEAAEKVANGDFSVYIPAIHTVDKLDYLDVMIMNFNKMVEELGSIETLKTDFLSNVSHEIKTPVAVIQNSAQMLQNQALTSAEHQEYVASILQSSRKLAGLITNILKLNKLEKQCIQPAREEYDLCAQLCDCAMQFENVWEEQEIVFEALIEDRAMIEADESLLEIVWTNLLSNAFKFTPKRGYVCLKQTSGEDQILVTVTDNGYGMDKSTMKHIFEKFYQGDTSRSTEGNGLGLALVLRIIRMLNGDIHVESDLGKGTSFTVTLPLNRK